jgi:glycerol-3-phosphate acyltransferase PlsX
MQGVAGPFWMLDLGANLECTAQELVQFARMGAELARAVGGVSFPRVALLNIGTEPTKGPAHIRAAAELFKNDSGFSYAGFIEANRLFRGEADVVVADGFAGNIALKAMEGAAWMAGQLLRRSFEGIGLIEQAGLAMARTRIRSLRRERYNGASLVGLAGVVVKSHGAADQEGFASAVQEAVHEVEAGLVARLGYR